jgi:pilus assembly protein CpaB
MRPVTILAVGLVASGTTAVLVYRAVQQRVVVRTEPVQTASTVEARPVVVAAVDLPLGSTLTESQLKIVPWPATALPGGGFDNPQAVAGRVLLTRLVANEPVTGGKLAPADTRGLLPLVIEPGMRAVTVRVNEVAGVAGFIVPGSRVDVLVTAEAADSQRHTTTLLQNVTVVALGQLLETDGTPKDSLSTATLLVSPEQAELLALGSNEGTLQLVMRNFEDRAVVVTGGKSVRDLFQLPATSPEVASTERVEVILGAERLAFNF